MSAITLESLVYQIDGTAYESRLVFDANISSPRPGLVMAPNWMGITEGAERIAQAVASQGYVVLLADLYGQGVRPSSPGEAVAAMTPLKSDRALLRKRMKQALEQLKAQKSASVDTANLAAFGFCFGGACALDLARAGAELKAAVSFHGTLDAPDPADAKRITGSVLVLHGEADPLVPREQIPAFIDEMNAAGVDWQLVSYGGAYHSFTDPEANNPGKQVYNKKVADRAFQAMHNLLAEVFQPQL
ncbi:dienelactone hydrolase family protein [Pseudomonas typographi]|uniref:Dienelactone hydrolase family protein n=1 Tax=Pseudomonas typographi TaxID=2715964 RepID=A0ABR7Z408_9PSED|nr:dienelactone hydrolase family protein [Pseudomonas typographi]MBD1552013.1 dienelactone hydrolase family protein [Pseudomonas typographi]MBD1586576.1 dienelactone hydrolase family protein [Pseudomonas typographi]MBD1600078.1 dienelactone hydrolase family protein [Pseudomonas typographi]